MSKHYFYYKVTKNVFTQLKKYIDGRAFWRKVDQEYIIKTPYKTFETHLKDFKITYEDSINS